MKHDMLHIWVEDHLIVTKQILKKSISYYVQLIQAKNYTELQKINTAFDELSSNSRKDKLILLCNYSQFEHAKEKEKRSHFAKIILKTLGEFDGDTSSRYFKKIKMFIKEPM